MISQTHDREFEVFYDGCCPICRREIAWLRGRDREQKIYFTDLADPSFDPSRFGKTLDEMMAQIHGRLPDGKIIVGVEVLRRLYDAVGFKRLVAFSRWPIVAQGLDLGYWMFAKLRTKLPRSRCSDQTCEI